jgi:hypothetical protein
MGLVLALPGMAWPDGGPVPAEVQLRPVRWQKLPPEVHDAFPGPDGRVWFVTRSPQRQRAFSGVFNPPRVALDTAKAEIAAAWSKSMPILATAWPVLLEKGGRIWFATDEGKALLGYDGRQWISIAAHEHLVNKHSFGVFNGVCPEHGRPWHAPANADLGDCQVFFESFGFDVFDGRNWSYQAFLEVPGNTIGMGVMTLPERDGQGLLVAVPQANTVWQVRGGRWTTLFQAAKPHPWVEAFRTAALGPNHQLWIQSGNGGIRVLSTLPAEVIAAQFDPLVPKLSDDDFQVREQAAAALRALGGRIEPQLRKALAAATDPEARERLGRLLDDLAHPRDAATLPIPGNVPGMEAGVVRRPMAIANDAWGNLYIDLQVSRPQTNEQAGRETIILDPEGGARLCQGVDGLAGDRSGPGMLPIVQAGGKIIWLDGAQGQRPARRIDLSTPEPTVQPVGDLAMVHVLAVAGDGTLFLTAEETEDFTAGTFVVAVKPAAPDDRQFTKTQSWESYYQADICLASDGTVWTWIKDQGLARFDGQRWEKMADDLEQPLMLVPGADGAVLEATGRGLVLYQAGKTFAGAQLEDLVHAHRAECTAAFQGPLDPLRWRWKREVVGSQGAHGWSLATDPAGRLWVASDGGVRVCDAGRWMEVEMPDLSKDWPDGWQPTSMPANMPVLRLSARNQPVDLTREPWLVLATNEPNTVVIIVQERAYTGFVARCWAYRASLVDGKVTVTPGPGRLGYQQLFRDGAGALWGLRDGVFVNLLDGKEAGGLPRSLYVPQLLDPSGALWVVGPKFDEFDLWRDGKVADHVSLAGVTYRAPLWSDKAGSVWARTQAGLAHYVAGPGPGAKYQLQATIPPVAGDGMPLLGWQPRDTVVSPRGFLVSKMDERFGIRGIVTHVRVLPLR